MIAGLAPARLCVVTDGRRLCQALGRPVTERGALVVSQARAAAAAGVGAFQLREPDLSAADLFDLTREVRDALAGRTTLLVNDRADIAAAAGVGVHLKASSLPAAALRDWLPADTRIWQAVHVRRDVELAGPVDALVAGTVLPSRSKGDHAALLGLEGLASIVAASPRPVMAIGGITGATWPAVAVTGAYGCAAIGAFVPGPGEDIAQAMARAVRAFAGIVD